MSQVRIPKPVVGVVAGYLTALVIGTGLLMVPFTSPGPGGIPFLSSLFTATSALSVTGLVVLDTGTQLSFYGQLVVLALIQVGGMGVMLFTMFLGMLVARKAGLQLRQTVAQETHSNAVGGVKALILRIVFYSIVTELLIAVVLFARFHLHYGMSVKHALWEGVFHAISSFNNAGFALRADSVTQFNTDPFILLPLCAGLIVGGLGFPVIMELLHRYRLPRSWSLTTRIVLVATPVLLFAGTLFFLVQEWRNPGTLGPMSPGVKLLNAFFHSAVSRTAGFNSFDISQMHPVSWFGTDILMFIGAGPAGTAGGLKVTTFAVLAAITWTEVTGGRAVNLLGRRLARSVHRQATTVVTLSLLVVMGATMFLMLQAPDHGLDRILFEVVSAFATVGLSTGITADLSPASQVVIILTMMVGRLGPVTLASALALQRRPLRYELPKERPLIG